MSLFSKKSVSYLGVDIGTSSVKMIELLDKGGQAVLKNYGFVEKLPKVETARTEDIINESAEIIKKIYKETGFTTKNAVAALHNFDVFSSVLNVPKTNLQEMEKTIRVEARKFVPIPLEDVVLDWKILRGETAASKSDKSAKPDKSDQQKKDKGKEPAAPPADELSLKEQGELEVLLTAAPRKLVKKYLEIFRVAELNILSLETESFSYVRALLDKNDTSSLMIINIGAAATDIIIIEKQVPVIIRTVDGGGIYITEAIAKNLGINIERAEQFKRDVGFYAGDAGSNSNQSQVVRQLIESAFVPVINEISYSLDLFRSRKLEVDRILLTGGSAYLLHLVDFLKATFKLPVYVGDPWHRINYSDELRKILEEIGPMFTVAAGLALKPIVES